MQGLFWAWRIQCRVTGAILPSYSLRYDEEANNEKISK